MVLFVSAIEWTWLTHNTDARCILEGREKPKWAEKTLCLNFSCFALNYEFLFHQLKADGVITTNYRKLIKKKKVKGNRYSRDGS